MNTDQTAPACHLQQTMRKNIFGTKKILAKTIGNIFFIQDFLFRIEIPSILNDN